MRVKYYGLVRSKQQSILRRYHLFYVYMILSGSIPVSHIVIQVVGTEAPCLAPAEPLVLSPLQRTGHRGVCLDILALREGRPQLADEGALLAVVQVAQQRLDGLGGLLSLIEGDSPVGGVSIL